MDILVLNCGSSSVKFALVDPASGVRAIEGLAERLGNPGSRLVIKQDGEKRERDLAGGGHDEALAAIGDVLTEIGAAPVAVGHRVVHGGESFTASQRVTDDVIRAVEGCAHLAPLHNPPNLLGIQAARNRFSDLPQVAVFDTAFHQTMPAVAFRYPVPKALYADHGVRRYGFHGTSHRYVSARAAEMLGQPLSGLRLVTAHLGNGCSACAIKGGESVDTTMGLTPLEGLVMGTRSGDVDPGLHEFLAKRLDTDVAGVTKILNQESGLLGLSGVANDMRSVRAAAAEGNPDAQLAIEVFCYRLAKHVASLAVACNGLDSLVFTGGIGENVAPIRAQVVGHLGFLGLRLDEAANQAHGGDTGGRITITTAPGAIVVPTDEELLIAQDTAALI